MRLGAPTDGQYGEAARTVVPVTGTTLDEALAEPELGWPEVGAVWVDTQGHEAHVLAGAEGAARSGVPFVVELWPYGLRRADGLERLLDLVAERFRRVVDLRDPGARPRPAAELAALADGLHGVGHTDVLLLP